MFCVKKILKTAAELELCLCTILFKTFSRAEAQVSWFCFAEVSAFLATVCSGVSFISAARIALSASLIMNPDHDSFMADWICVFAVLNLLVLPFIMKLEAETT